LFIPSLGVFAGLSFAQAAPVEIIAHRGGALCAPENTCAAIRACSGLVNRVEFDLRTSADGELVLMHDETVNWTTVGFGTATNVADLTLAQLKALDAGVKFSPAFAGERVPTLSEAIHALPPGVFPLIDCKAVTPEALITALRTENMLSNAVVSSGSENFLVAIRQLEPDLHLCFGGTGELAPSTLARLKGIGVSTVTWMKDSVAPSLIAQVHACGLRLYVATLSSPEVEVFLNMGVDGFLIDNPRNAFGYVGLLPPTNAQLAGELVAYWKLDDGLLDPTAARAEDREGHSPLLLAGSDAAPAWISGGAARFGGALRLDGINDYALVPPNPILDLGTNAVSVSLWVKLAARPSALSNDFAGIYHSSSDAYSFYLDKAQKELRFKVTDASFNAARPGIPEAKLQTGIWHHVVGVYDGSAGSAIGQATIYLDGRIVDVVSGNDYTGFGLTNLVLCGQAAAIGRKGQLHDCYFAGAVDDVALWRRALSPADVRRIHGAGAQGRPLETLVMTNGTTGIDSNPSPADSGNDLVFGGQPQLQEKAVNPSLPFRSQLASHLVAYWKLDDGLQDSTTVTAEDAAGDNRGRLVGYSFDPGWISGTEARAGGALRLDGIRNYVRIPAYESLDIGTNACSISLWMKLAALPAGLSRDFSFIYGSDLAAYAIYLDRKSRALRFTVTDTRLQAASPGIPEADLQTGVWHHVVGVFDGSAGPAAGQALIYLDGQLRDTHVGADASPGQGLTQAVLPGQYAAIGRKGDQDDFYFSGTVDDVALWRRALSPTEISQIHDAGQSGIPLEEINRR
jgi:glycerophosphoryl diester phosphodiesterase